MRFFPLLVIVTGGKQHVITMFIDYLLDAFYNLAHKDTQGIGKYHAHGFGPSGIQGPGKVVGLIVIFPGYLKNLFPGLLRGTWMTAEDIRNRGLGDTGLFGYLF